MRTSAQPDTWDGIEQVVFIDDRNVFNRAIIAQPHSARARGRLLRVH